MVTASANFTWTLNAFERNGKLWLSWETNAPFRAQQSQVYVYNNVFPEKPVNRNLAAWHWIQTNGSWDTGLEYGTGWNCAIGAQDIDSGTEGPYVYVVKVTT